MTDLKNKIEKFETRTPLKRTGEPNDIAELVLAVIIAIPVNVEREFSTRWGVFRGRTAILPSKCKCKFILRAAYIKQEQFPYFRELR